MSDIAELAAQLIAIESINPGVVAEWCERTGLETTLTELAPGRANVVAIARDSALLAGAGIPTVLFGPIGEGAHAEVEWVDIASLAQCAEIYVGVATDLCR